MLIRMILGLAMTAVALVVAGRRVLYLYRVATAGQPDPTRTLSLGPTAKAEVTEVLVQRKLLKWTVPGLAHLAAFWGFMLLLITVIEGFGALFQRDFAIPVIGHQAWLGFLEDTMALLTAASVVVFAVIRLQNAPKNLGRRSRFFGSHLDAAWLVLFMIFNVVWTLLLYRGAQINTGYFPYARGAYASEAVAKVLKPLGHNANTVLEHVGVLLALGVVFAFLVLVVHSKHMHIFTAPLNVAFARRRSAAGNALGALQPVYSGGKPVDFEDPGEDDLMGRGTIADFTWKGVLDLLSCTECGRCQSQCPAWNTGKPLSPKLVVMGLRDHALARAPYTLAADDEARAALPEAVRAEGERALVGAPDPDEGDTAVIPADVLWSCTTCGACVNQCPVDIEHIDHIVDLRRYQMLVEGAFPGEAEVMLRNLEHAGDPWGRGASARTEWMAGLDFEVPVFGADGEDKLADDVEYLYWVGCAGALDDTAQRTSRAVATLLHQAGVNYVVLGEGETCTGDAARRIGHEFLFHMLASTNVETLNEIGARRIVVTCAHCFNTIANEYPQLGGTYEVVHHSTLLARLVAEGRLTPVQSLQVDGRDTAITYHDACYLGRHNQIFTPPREVLGAVPGARVVEMPRSGERSFCCGAGGARMWMDETIGERINTNRAREALSLKPDLVAAACPFCIVMLTDGVRAVDTENGADAAAEASVPVSDISEILLQACGVGPAVGPDSSSPSTATDSTEGMSR